MAAFLRTNDSMAGLVMRLGLGVVMFPHGAQKVFQVWGGYGFDGTVQYFTTTLGLPYALAVLVIAAEFLGSLALILGFLTRLAAFGILCVMAGAIVMVHKDVGFFMNWNGNQAGEGFEYHLLALALALALLIQGGGALSLDRRLAKQR